MNSYISILVIAALLGLSINTGKQIPFSPASDYECKELTTDQASFECFKGSTIYSKCPKGSHCLQSDNTSAGYRCVKDTKKVKLGKKCKYHEDCIEGTYCNSGKCSVQASKDFHCNTGKLGKINCRFDQYCDSTSTTTVPQCKTKPKKVNDVCIYGSTDPKEKCPFYTNCRKDIGGTEYHCRKWGLIEDGIVVPNGGTVEDCISGVWTSDSEKKCTSLDYVGDCIKRYELNENEMGQCSAPLCFRYKYSTDAVEQVRQCYVGYSYGMNHKYAPNLSKAKQETWKTFMKELNDLDLDKYKKDKYQEYTENDQLKFFGDNSLTEKYFKYKYATDLHRYGYITEKGKVRLDRKCVYEFFFKNSMQFLKSSTLFSLLIIGLLL